MTRFLPIQLKNVSRRTAVAAAAVIALLVIGVTAAAIRAAHEGSTPARATVARNTPAPPVPDETTAAAFAKAAGEPVPGTAVEEKTVAATTTVTLTGCLERDEQSFRLKDTTGKDAPKSRSWKTGFFTKRNASITVADKANRVNLKTHVGQRVSVTGTLVDREMQVRSLQRVASTCTAGAKA